MRLKKYLVIAMSTLTLMSSFSTYASADEVPSGTESIVESNNETLDSTAESGVDEIATTGTATSNDPINLDTWDHKSNFPDENGELRFWMDDLEDRLNTLTLSYIYDDGNKPIPKAQISVYQIGTLTVKNGDAKYELVDEIKEKHSEINLAGMSTEELDAFAAKLVAEGNLKATAKLETGKDGVAKFENLKHGLYLVAQTAKTGPAEAYEDFKPFIIQIPFPSTTENMVEGHWIYEVEALPKTNIPAKKKIIIVPPHKTGDEITYAYINMIVAFAGISFITAITAIVLLVKNKKKQQNTNS